MPRLPEPIPPSIMHEVAREIVARERVEDERLGQAVALLKYALHLRMHGERAPGGNETWREFDRRCEDFLRSLL